MLRVSGIQTSGPPGQDPGVLSSPEFRYGAKVCVEEESDMRGHLFKLFSFLRATTEDKTPRQMANENLPASLAALWGGFQRRNHTCVF